MDNNELAMMLDDIIKELRRTDTDYGIEAEAKICQLYLKIVDKEGIKLSHGDAKKILDDHLEWRSKQNPYTDMNAGFRENYQRWIQLIIETDGI